LPFSESFAGACRPKDNAWTSEGCGFMRIDADRKQGVCIRFTGVDPRSSATNLAFQNNPPDMDLTLLFNTFDDKEHLLRR
jgi:hypothetical protein